MSMTESDRRLMAEYRERVRMHDALTGSCADLRRERGKAVRDQHEATAEALERLSNDLTAAQAEIARLRAKHDKARREMQNRIVEQRKNIRRLQSVEKCHWQSVNRWKSEREALTAERDAAMAERAEPVATTVYLTLTYTNWRGETALRTIIPRRVWFGSTDWHPEPQWLLTALDVEKKAHRDFALKDFGGARAREITVQEAADVPEVKALIEALHAARDCMSAASDQLTKRHAKGLKGKRWGWWYLDLVNDAIAAMRKG